MLIVEDEALIRWPLKQRLEEEGYSVIEAADGATALDRLSHDGIKGVLLDLRLPDIDGMEILRKLRQTHPDCRVWIMTAYGTPEVRAEAAQLGIEEFVDKPFDVEALIQKLVARLGE
jgi:CheY-like chemotaxis protein